MAGLKGGRTVNSPVKQMNAVKQAVQRAAPAPVYVAPKPLPTGGGGGRSLPPRTPPPPGSPPSPWSPGIYDDLLGNAKDSGWYNDNSPIGRYIQNLPPDRRASVRPGVRYYEDESILLQNKTTGNYAMMPMPTWMENRGQLGPDYTPVSGAFNQEDTPYLGSQGGAMEFDLVDPSWVGQQVVPTAPTDMMPVMNRDMSDPYNPIVITPDKLPGTIASNPFIAYLAQLYPELYGRW